MSIGVGYEPGIGYRQLNYSASDAWIKNSRNQEEVPKYAFTTGLNINYRLSRRIGLECGVLFASKGIKTKKEDLAWIAEDPSFPVKSRTTFAFRFIDIPLTVNYNFYFRRLKLYVSAGISMSNFINKKTTVISYYANGDNTKSAHLQNFGYRPSSYAVILACGVSLPLSGRFVLQLEPVYRQGITSIMKDKQAQEYLYTLGLNTKLFYRLKKKSQ